MGPGGSDLWDKKRPVAREVYPIATCMVPSSRFTYVHPSYMPGAVAFVEQFGMPTFSHTPIVAGTCVYV